MFHIFVAADIKFVGVTTSGLLRVEISLTMHTFISVYNYTRAQLRGTRLVCKCLQSPNLCMVAKIICVW